MSPRVLLTGLFACVVALIAGLQLVGGDDAYELNLRLKSANGLRNGSEVRTGGVPVGRVLALKLGPKDAVDVRMALDDGHDAVGRNATARIVATNLVGEKYVELDPGDTRTPLASGAWLPTRRVSTSVDLDQVLDVLDSGVRTRLAVLINETGFALTHRRADFNAFLHELPPALSAGRKLVGQLAQDNHTVGDVVDRAGRLVARVNAERDELNRMVDVTGKTAAAVAAKRAQLRQTLAEAPTTLASADRLLTDLQDTTRPLASAARLITRTAPGLRATLTQVEPFEASARPALDEVPDLAPELTRLGVKAAPVARQAVPTAKALTALLTTSGPATRTLGASVDDLLGLAEGWSRSIQLRDGLSHVFRGRASISVDTIQTLTRRLQLLSPTAPARRTGGTGGATKPGPAPSGAAATPARQDDRRPGPAKALKDVVGKTQDTVTGVLAKLLPGLAGPAGSAPAPAPDDSRDDPAGALLDFLLKP
ncbi:hypothetical protein DSM112329_01722 [Paraconexibacter sp. AEG42_29]|uniref:Mce/MlaD domain-containing protein n=1 Tax=Paraconexibacter sp. AEG42_29 TaxID=2997339 RepID=A0AAU7AU61_9ACTN